MQFLCNISVKTAFARSNNRFDHGLRCCCINCHPEVISQISQLLIVELASVIGEHPNFRNTINTHPTLHETVYYGVITFIADNLCSGQSFKHVNIMKVPTRLAELMQVKSHNFIKGSGV